MMDKTFDPLADAAGFRAALGRFATGVTVVTTKAENGPLGFTANSFASVSLSPPLVLWSPARSSSRFHAFAHAQNFSIHVLAVEQHDLIARFARGGSGFDGLDHGYSPEEVPVLNDVLSRFDCVQHASHDGGDHQIIVGRVLRAALRDGAPLVFNQGAYGGFVRGG